jgi:V/A-type H+/Na+-transporting ATPase subunit B
MYAESKKARERQSMGFKLSRWDEQLLNYSYLFEEQMMSLDVNLRLEEALNIGWKILAECFQEDEVGIRESILMKYWPAK